MRAFLSLQFGGEGIAGEAYFDDLTVAFETIRKFERYLVSIPVKVDVTN